MTTFRRTGNPIQYGDDTKAPRFWDEKAPNERWTKTLPSIQIPEPIYEALQELAMSPEHEYGGKVAPIVREALEEFINKYGVEGNINPGVRMTLFKQMRDVRDLWAEEIIASEMVNLIQVMEQSIDRWTKAEDSEKLTAQFNKCMASIGSVPFGWQQFIKERLRESAIVARAFEFVFEAGDTHEKEIAHIVHGVIYD